MSNVNMPPPPSSSSSSSSSFTLDFPTVFSVGFALSFLPVAWVLAARLIPAAETRNRVLFFWHAYDALTHLFIEGSFLYESFFSYVELPRLPTAAVVVVSEPYFLGHKNRLYGPAYGHGPTARLWQEYAKADHRWGLSDPTVVSLEILTVFLGGPAAVYICYLLYLASHPSAASSSSTAAAAAAASSRAHASAKSKLWLVAPALAIAELYGGWMTFAPEWLTASSQLETGHPVYLWLYLVFFNVLWVFLPIWVLVQTAKELRHTFTVAELATSLKKKH